MTRACARDALLFDQQARANCPFCRRATWLPQCDYAEAGGLISYGADVIEVAELQEEQLAIHQQATAAAAANKQVTIESLIAEAEAARAKAMSEKGGAAAAVSALTAKAKLAGMWREKVDQHNTGTGTVSTVWSVSWDEKGEQSDGREAG